MYLPMIGKPSFSAVYYIYIKVKDHSFFFIICIFFSFFFTFLFINKTAAAPSETWEALPAVVEPSSSKAGLSLPSFSAVVPGLTPSSLSATTLDSFSSLSKTVAVMGTISSLNQPFFWASTALRWDSAENSSCFWRVIPNSAATFSEVILFFLI